MADFWRTIARGWISITMAVGCTRHAPPEASRLSRLVISGVHGARYSHLRISNPSGDCADIRDSSDVELDDVTIGPCNGRGIHVSDSAGIIVRRASVAPAYQPVSCCDEGAAILVEHVNGLTIVDSSIERAESLIEVIHSRGVEIVHDQLRDPLGPFPRGQMVQLQRDSTDIVIRDNLFRCERATGCKQQDAINIYSADRVTVLRNQIEGGASATGCGILVDGYGAHHVELRENVLRAQTDGNGGGCGIGIAGGTDIHVAHNTALGYGNVGFYVWPQPQHAACERVSFVANRAGHGEPRHGKTWDNAFWNSGECRNVDSSQNSWD